MCSVCVQCVCITCVVCVCAVCVYHMCSVVLFACIGVCVCVRRCVCLSCPVNLITKTMNCFFVLHYIAEHIFLPLIRSNLPRFSDISIRHIAIILNPPPPSFSSSPPSHRPPPLTTASTLHHLPSTTNLKLGLCCLICVMICNAAYIMYTNYHYHYHYFSHIYEPSLSI